MNAIDIKNLTKTFPRCKALDNVSISVKRGEMVALLGASGSGKSTLLRHLPGFLVADEGEVCVLGKSVQSGNRVCKNIREIRRELGFIFQQFNLVNRLSVATNVLIGLLHRMSFWRRLLMRFSITEKQQAQEAMASVGIEQMAWRRAVSLSGGQQQRAALARCLVQGAKIILADEPIASLDPESSRKVMDLLAQMNRQHSCTVLVSLHQVEFAIKYCPRTIALNQGRVVYDGPSAALTPLLLSKLYGSSVSELFEPNNTDETPQPDRMRILPQGLIAA